MCRSAILCISILLCSATIVIGSLPFCTSGGLVGSAAGTEDFFEADGACFCSGSLVVEHGHQAQDACEDLVTPPSGYAIRVAKISSDNVRLGLEAMYNLSWSVIATGVNAVFVDPDVLSAGLTGWDEHSVGENTGRCAVAYALGKVYYRVKCYGSTLTGHNNNRHALCEIYQPQPGAQTFCTRSAGLVGVAPGTEDYFAVGDRCFYSGTALVPHANESQAACESFLSAVPRTYAVRLGKVDTDAVLERLEYTYDALHTHLPTGIHSLYIDSEALSSIPTGWAFDSAVEPTGECALANPYPRGVYQIHCHDTTLNGLINQHALCEIYRPMSDRLASTEISLNKYSGKRININILEIVSWTISDSNECVIECLRDAKCGAVEWGDVTKTCRLFPVGLEATSDLEDDFDYTSFV